MAPGESLDDELALAADRLDQLVRRLRSLSPRAWVSRQAAVEEIVAELVEITGRLELRDLKQPEVPVHVLPDVVALIGGDLLEAIRSGADITVAREVGAAIASALDSTR